MIDLKRYEQLKSKVDRLQREADRAEGALGKLMEELRDGFDCGSLEEAEKLHAELSKKSEKAERAYDRKLAVFEKKWKNVLDGEDGSRSPSQKAFDILLAEETECL